MAEDYKGQFKDISKEYGITIKRIKELDKQGRLSRYLDYLDAIKEDDSRASQAIRIGADFSGGGLATKKYVNPVKITNNLKRSK
tara:strand:+ start:836 stop:1087 length:252 start_codon:yes stop_codon:yes gene_type:complete